MSENKTAPHVRTKPHQQTSQGRKRLSKIKLPVYNEVDSHKWANKTEVSRLLLA